MIKAASKRDIAIYKRLMSVRHPYDELHIARSLSDNRRLCRDLKIDIYFDDQDECVVGVGEETTVFKIRNGGNFDFDERKWISTAKLTRLL